MATLIDAQLILPSIHLRKMVQAFANFQSVDPTPEDFKLAIETAKSIRFRLTADQILMLMPLPNDCAGKFAAGFSRIDSLADYTEFVPEEAFAIDGHEERKKTAIRMHAIAADAYALIKEARNVADDYRLVSGEQIMEARARVFGERPEAADSN